MPRALVLKPDVLREDDEQADLIMLIDRFEHKYPDFQYVYHVANGGWRGATAGGKMKAAGVRPGVPDLEFDQARGGFFGLRIEMKRTNASPSDTSPDQRRWHQWLRDQGYCVHVCKGCKAAWRVLIWYHSLPPTVVVPQNNDDLPSA